MISDDQAWCFTYYWNWVEEHVALREEISFGSDGRPFNFGEKIALMHSELSEALEAYRKDLMDSHLPLRKGVEVELADAVIRIMGTARKLGLDLAGAIIAKADYNDTREDHKPENRKGEHGKRF